jgi:hypothetical protein
MFIINVTLLSEGRGMGVLTTVPKVGQKIIGI